MFEFDEPDSRESIGAALEKLHGEIDEYMASFPTPRFFESQGEHWSPAEHLRHLVKSVRAAVRGMGMPKPVIGLTFGKNKGASRSFAEVVKVYQAELAAGATAGPYTPAERDVDMSEESWRELILERWRSAGLELQAAIAGWDESQLDRYRLPHPLLGKMTVREILFFTLYHNAHHARRVEERAA